MFDYCVFGWRENTRTHLGGGNTKLEDLQRTLASYSVTNGSTLMLIILERFLLYVIGLDGAIHEVEVPSSDPEVKLNVLLICKCAEITRLLQTC